MNIVLLVFLVTVARIRCTQLIDENKLDKVEDKTDEKVENNLDKAKDKTDDKVENNLDKAKDKTDDKVENNLDKAKDKTDEKVDEELEKKPTEKPVEKQEEKVHYYKANIDRRFLDDLDDYEWHVAHLRAADFDGRRDCMDDTFVDKVRRYRKMLKSDGALVEFVSSDPIPVQPDEIFKDSCKLGEESPQYSPNITISPATTITNYVENVSPTTLSHSVASNVTNTTSVTNTTASMTVETTTLKLESQATPVQSPTPTSTVAKPKAQAENDTMDKVRRASEYMFSSIEYYDESIEFDVDDCPAAVEAITLELDQLRSYDLECEMIIEWWSLE